MVGQEPEIEVALVQWLHVRSLPTYSIRVEGTRGRHTDSRPNLHGERRGADRTNVSKL